MNKKRSTYIRTIQTQNPKPKFQIILTSFVVLLFLFFTSCKEEEPIYSCNETIDSWVKENIKEISSFDRKTISTYSRGYRKAILRSFSPNRKKALWQEKINNIMSLDLSKDEMEYLKWYETAFKRMDYSKLDKKLSIEMYNKTVEGMKKFGWSRNFVYQVFFTINDTNLEELTIPQLENKQIVEPEVPDCDCYYNLGCGWGGSCAQEGCNEVEGCGVFGGADCSGNC